MRNQALGRDDTNGRDELVARGKWRTWVGDEGTLDFTFLHADIDNGYDAWTLDGSRETQTNAPGVDRQRTDAASLRLDDAAVGDNALTAVASYARTKTLYGYDYDWGSTAFWEPYFYEGDEYWDRKRRTGSLELRLASHLADAPGSVAWLAGAYALRLEEDGRYTSAGEYVDPVDPDFSWADERLLDDRYRATSLALFGQLDGNLARDWRWSAGMRVEQRRARYRDSGEVNGDVQLSDFRARDRMVGGQASLSRDFGDDLTGYALVSRGYKAGGFNLRAVPDELRDFEPEFLWNLETGLRAKLADGRGRASAAMFYQRRRDQQVRSGRQLVGGGPYEFVTTNLPAGYSAGIEASLDYEVGRRWSIGASLGLLRSRTGETVNEDGDPVPSRESAHAPGYTAAINAAWRHPGGFFARIDVSATDAFYFDVPTDHDQRSRAYVLTHLKVGFERHNWRIHGWLRNAFDRQYAVRGFYFGNDPRAGWADGLYRQWGDPRQLGVTVAVDFGSGGM
jgi:outer membrane receptor protein involved in Fe transport